MAPPLWPTAMVNHLHHHATTSAPGLMKVGKAGNRNECQDAYGAEAKSEGVTPARCVAFPTMFDVRLLQKLYAKAEHQVRHPDQFIRHLPGPRRSWHLTWQ